MFLKNKSNKPSNLLYYFKNKPIEEQRSVNGKIIHILLYVSVAASLW